MGLFITLAEATARMRKEAASSGVLDTPFGAPATLYGKFARLQILTIEDLFAGKKPAMPPEDPADIGARYDWRPLGESNPCFRRERGENRTFADNPGQVKMNNMLT